MISVDMSSTMDSDTHSVYFNTSLYGQGLSCIAAGQGSSMYVFTSSALFGHYHFGKASTRYSLSGLLNRKEETSYYGWACNPIERESIWVMSSGD